jgi:hypothetical protein
MNIAIIFIGTGRYLDYLPAYYENNEKYLFKKSRKQYFVFTDGEIENPPDNMSVYSIQHKEWPFITLERFQTILLAEKELKNYDWILFLDADTLTTSRIAEEEVLQNKLIGVHHPCHYLQMPPHDAFPGALETDPRSSAAVSESDVAPFYYQGCLWGGKTNEALEMMRELDRRTKTDYEKGVIAVWHDESHLNKYFIENAKMVHTLSSSYAFPEVFESYCSFEKKIIHLAKENSLYHK